MINLLNINNTSVAKAVFSVFQASYQIEADLIGTDNFPPLQRTCAQIQAASSQFYGFFVEDQLAGVIEVSIDNSMLDIDSLTVHPSFFKRGIASQLINYVLSELCFTHARVETAVVNKPAVALYNKHGFIAYKTWTPDHGIEKIALKITP